MIDYKDLKVEMEVEALSWIGDEESWRVAKVVRVCPKRGRRGYVILAIPLPHCPTNQVRRVPAELRLKPEGGGR